MSYELLPDNLNYLLIPMLNLAKTLPVSSPLQISFSSVSVSVHKAGVEHDENVAGANMMVVGWSMSLTNARNLTRMRPRIFLVFEITS